MNVSLLICFISFSIYTILLTLTETRIFFKLVFRNFCQVKSETCSIPSIELPCNCTDKTSWKCHVNLFLLALETQKKILLKSSMEVSWIILMKLNSVLIISPVLSWSSYSGMCLFFFSSWNIKIWEIKDLIDQVTWLWIHHDDLPFSPMHCNICALPSNFHQTTCVLNLKIWRIMWLMCTLTFWMNQFAPLDIPASVDTFLGHWKPNAIMLMESELWPNLIIGASKSGVSCYFSRNWTF